LTVSLPICIPFISSSCLIALARNSRTIIQTKNQWRNSRTKSHHRSNGPSWCQQNISSNFCTIYILLSTPWNFLQNWSYLRAQSKPQQIKENRNNPLHFIWSQYNKTRTQQQKQQEKIRKQLEAEHTLLNDQWVIDEIKEEFKRFLEVNENENMT
jgi:hypothetical protein